MIMAIFLEFFIIWTIDKSTLNPNPIIFVRKSFFGILFSNISNTSKLSDGTLNYPFITTQHPPLSCPSWWIKPLVCRMLRSRRIVLASTLKCVASEADVSRTLSRTLICPVSISDTLGCTLSNILCRSHICHHDKAAIDRPCSHYDFFLFRTRSHVLANFMSLRASKRIGSL